MRARSLPRSVGAAFLRTLALACTTLAVASPAFAEGKSEAKAAAPTPGHDPNNVTGISDAMVEVVAGNEAFVAKDLSGAVEHYKRAIQVQPKNPLGYFMLGEAQLAMGNPDEAEQSWKEGDAVADPVPEVKSRILFAVADLKERQKKWEEARAGWQKFTDYANLKGVGYPESGAARLKALDTMMKQEKAYEVVRQRIADERAAAAKGPETAPPATPPKKK